MASFPSDPDIPRVPPTGTDRLTTGVLPILKSRLELARRARRIVALLAASVVAVFVAHAWLLVILPNEQRSLANEAAQASSYLIAAVCATLAATQVPRGRERLAWSFLALAFTANAAAEAIYAYQEIILHATNLFVTPADAFYLAFYPVAAIGVLLLPGQVDSGPGRVIILLDAAILATAILGLSVYFLIGPLYLAGSQSAFGLAVNLAYPVGDILIAGALVALFLRGGPPLYRPIYVWLMLGMLSQVYADSGYLYLGLQGTYIQGTLGVDPFWPLGALLMSVAALRVLIGRESVDGRVSATKQVEPAPVDDVLEAQTELVSLPESLSRNVAPYVPIGIMAVLFWLAQPPSPNAQLFPAIEAIAVLVILLIVTRQILTFRELVDAHVANKRARELDTLKDQFITNVNHELRTPLMALNGYVKLLQARHATLSSERQEQLIEKAARAGDDVVALVTSILNAQILDQGADTTTMEPVELAAAVVSAVGLIEPRDIDQGDGNLVERELRLHIPRDLAVLGDPMRVRQILINLLSNAIKYSPAGSPVEIAAHMTTELTSSPQSVKGRRGKRNLRRPMVEMTVRDYGLGIPPEQMGLLFHRFVRLPRDLASAISGNGLGLSLCQKLTVAMGGRIWAESTGVEGEGSTFHVLLPQALESDTMREHDQIGQQTQRNNVVRPATEDPEGVISGRGS
jgi:signal transduction histidine kinase